MNCTRIGRLSKHVPPFPSCTLFELPRRVVRHPSLEVCLKAAKETLRLRAEATELRVVVLTILQQYVFSVSFILVQSPVLPHVYVMKEKRLIAV